jgi:RNA polymerase sigma-70 factor (ECF subfamily)
MFPTDRKRYSDQHTSIGQDAPMSLTEAELVARFWDRVRLFAARRVGDATAAEDIAQETLRRVVEALRAGRVENVDAMAGFVFQTAKHVCMHAHRSAGREAQAMRRLGDPSASGDVQPDALTSLVSEERRARVRTALESLAREDRDLLRALYFDQLDTSELSARLGVSHGALRVRKHRALQRLADVLQMQTSGETLSTERELTR